MNEYRGKHAPSSPWAVASTSTVPVRHSRHLRKSRRRRIRTVLVLLVLLIAVVYPFAEARILTTEKVRLVSEDLPADANHLRIVYLSDIHWGFWFGDSDLNGLISRINSLRPDLVLFGGDYATDHAGALLFFRRMQEMPRTGPFFRKPWPTPESRPCSTVLSLFRSAAGGSVSPDWTMLSAESPT